MYTTSLTSDFISLSTSTPSYVRTVRQAPQHFVTYSTDGALYLSGSYLTTAAYDYVHGRRWAP